MSPRVLLLGGHGKVSLLMTPHLLSRSWQVTSVIRNPDQKTDIIAAGKNQPGQLDVLVASLEDVKSAADAKKILDQTRPDYVVWSAGAGGKGGPSRTYAIDRDACRHFITSSVSSPNIQKFLLVSALSERRHRAPWWDDASWTSTQKVNTQVMPDYYKAKLAADEYLTVKAEERIQGGDSEFQYIILRPGALVDEPTKGKVAMGKIGTKGSVTRGDVADVAVRLLESGGARGWFDLLNGEEETSAAVERVLREGINSMEGESLDEMRKDVNGG